MLSIIIRFGGNRLFTVLAPRCFSQRCLFGPFGVNPTDPDAVRRLVGTHLFQTWIPRVQSGEYPQHRRSEIRLAAGIRYALPSNLWDAFGNQEARVELLGLRTRG